MSKKMIPIAFKWLNPEMNGELGLPSYETAGSAGMDICAATESDLTISAGDIALVPTGFAVAIPDGYELQIRPRSGLAVKHGITLINAPGTIDSDYRGEVRIGLVNLGKQAFTIKRGDRIAQMILAPVVRAEISIVAELGTTERGSGGFGHTGLK